MYKVFFNDRQLILTDDFTRHFQVRYGLFYKYRDKEDMEELISFYNRLSSINSLYIFHTDLDELRDVFRQCFTQLEAAGGLVRNAKGEFLLIFRRGKWDLPKGKLDKNESFETAALREVKEECGIKDLKIIGPLLSTYHTYPYKTELALKKTMWFEMACEGKDKLKPQKDEDIEEAIWVNASDLKSYLDKSFPTIRDVFTCFGY